MSHYKELPVQIAFNLKKKMFQKGLWSVGSSLPNLDLFYSLLSFHFQV